MFHQSISHGSSKLITQCPVENKASRFCNRHGNPFGGVRPPNVCATVGESAQCDCEERDELCGEEPDQSTKLRVQLLRKIGTNLNLEKLEIALAHHVTPTRWRETFHQCVGHGVSKVVAQCLMKFESMRFADSHGNPFGGVRPPNVCATVGESARCNLGKCYKMRRENFRRRHQSPRR